MRAWIIILRFTGMLLFLIAVVGGFIRVIVLPNLSSWLDAFDYVLPIVGGLVGAAICFGVAAGLEGILHVAARLDAVEQRPVPAANLPAPAVLVTVTPEVNSGIIPVDPALNAPEDRPPAKLAAPAALVTITPEVKSEIIPAADPDAPAEPATVVPEVKSPDPSRLSVFAAALRHRLSPELLRVVRSFAAAVLTLVAVGLMIISTVLFKPSELYTNPPLLQATLAALLGGAALLVAQFLTPHTVKTTDLAETGISQGRINWIFFVPGLALLAVATESSANYFQTGVLNLLTTDQQFAIFLGGLVLFSLGLIGVGRRSRLHLHWDWAEVLPVAAIFVLALVLRVYQLDSLHVSVDEGHYMMGVYDLIPADHSNTPLMLTVDGNLPATMLYSYFDLGTSTLLGRNLIGLRIASAILGTLGVLAVYAVGRVLFNRRMAIIAGLILATFPMNLFYSRVTTGNLGDVLFSTLAILFAVRAFRRNRRADWVLMGVNLGLSQYFFEGGRLLFPPVFLCWFILMALLLLGKFKRFGHGVFLGVFATIIVVTPMYFSMWATHTEFTVRLSDDGINTETFVSAAKGELPPDQETQVLNHIAAPFLVYTFYTHQDMAEMYGGYEPVVLRIFAPLFLLGLFHALRRLRSGASLLLIMVFGASMGAILVADPLIFARYSIITGALSLLMAFGLVCTLPMLNPFPPASAADQSPRAVAIRQRWTKIGAGVVVLLGLVIAVVQIDYFFTHLIPEFNLSYRNALVSGDMLDASWRFLEMPDVTDDQMVVFDNAQAAENMASQLLDYSIGPRKYPLALYDTDNVSLADLDNLPRDHTYVFYVIPTDTRMIDMLHTSFVLEPPAMSPWPSPVPRVEYVQYIALHAKNALPQH